MHTFPWDRQQRRETGKVVLAWQENGEPSDLQDVEP
jgi:hypothetical protein